jgi:Fe2+ transport system protein FeoA
MDQTLEIMEEEEEMKLTERDKKILETMGVGVVEKEKANVPLGLAEREVSQFVCPLKELEANERGTIAYLATEDEERLRKLMAMGAMPGLKITMIQKFPSYVFKVGETQFAIDEEMAEGIYVRLER